MYGLESWKAFWMSSRRGFSFSGSEHFHDVETKRDLGIVEHAQPGQCAA